LGEKVRGNLVIIGGAEDKKGECKILRKVVELSGGKNSCMVILTTATEHPEEVGREYRRIFERIGVGETNVINIDSRRDAWREDYIKIIKNATCVFFTGGDQLRITSILGGTPVYSILHELYMEGVPIVGTSAGASAMSSPMIVDGNSSDTPRKNTISMAPGLGLLKDVVIDQHFAQRGRIGRLLTAIAQNPYILGIGIDEDTAIIVTPDQCFQVIGSNAVTVLDGRNLSHTNVSELKPNETLALTDVVIHILPNGYGFDLNNRKPLIF